MKKTRKILGIVTVLALSAVVVSAGLLTMYGKIETKATVQQSVLLDGEDINGNVGWEHELDDVSAGCKKCFKHTLENQACKEAEINVETTVDGQGKGPDGVTTTMYDLSPNEMEFTEGIAGWGGPTFDFTEPTYEDTEYTGEIYDFGWDPLYWTIDYTLDCNVRFTLTPPNDIANPPGNFWIEFDSNNDGIKDFQVRWHEDPTDAVPTDSHWGYKYYEDDSWSDWQEPLPSWFNGFVDGDNFVIEIDSDQLGNQNGYQDDCGLSFGYATFVVVPGPDGFLGGNNGGCVIIPIEDETNYFVSQTIGDNLVSPIVLDAGEELMFCICYDFAINIIPGRYDITTTFSPVTSG